jgi:2-iminobutanoate/2-iminopropanoate deaminase
MGRQIISTPDVPSSPYFAQGVRAGFQIWVSGMAGIDPVTGELAGASIQEQALQALTNCERVVAAGGGTRDDIVEVGVLLAEPDDFAGLNEVYEGYFGDDPPVRYVARLGPVLPGVRVSIRVTAVLG